jgi:hypothetical protein
MKKIRIPVNENIITLFPEAFMISHLPRKKKKALKKKLGVMLTNWLIDEITKEDLINEIKKQSINHG